MLRNQVQGGGNVGNALTAAARLGLKPRVYSKVMDTPACKGLISLEELQPGLFYHVLLVRGRVSDFLQCAVSPRQSSFRS